LILLTIHISTFVIIGLHHSYAVCVNYIFPHGVSLFSVLIWPSVSSYYFFIFSRVELTIYSLSIGEKKRKRKLDDAVAADSPSNRNIKVARSMSAAPDTHNGLQKDSEVAYRLPKQKNAEGMWIQCIIVGIVGDGNKRKYEISKTIVAPCPRSIVHTALR